MTLPADAQRFLGHHYRQDLAAKNEARDALATQTPHLLKVEAERDALTAKLDAVRDVHVSHADIYDGTVWCRECLSPWPCPTVAILGDVLS